MLFDAPAVKLSADNKLAWEMDADIVNEMLKKQTKLVGHN